MRELLNFLNTDYELVKGVSLSVMNIIVLIIMLAIAKLILKLIESVITKKLPTNDSLKFNGAFSYLNWIVYLVIFIATLSSMGINVNAIFAASAALLIGVGLALQTLFQDIISGIFILIDQSVHVGDIIEIEGKVGKVEEIKFRTTRAVTLDNKVLIIPNHLYLTNSLYNWTQNGKITRESVTVGVAYGSDIELVKKLLIQAANSQATVLEKPEPSVLFEDFGDSSLNFKLVFTLADSFKAQFPKSDIRFEIDKLFRVNNISIPFPQRDIHVYSNTQALVK